MRRVVAVTVQGGTEMYWPDVRPRLEAYVARCPDTELLVSTRAAWPAAASDLFLAKWSGVVTASIRGVDEVLQLDVDILLTADAPCVFDVLPYGNDQLWLLACTGGEYARRQTALVRAAFHGCDTMPMTAYRNSGACLLRGDAIGWLATELQRMRPGVVGGQRLYDQELLAAALWRSQREVLPLPAAWNQLVQEPDLPAWLGRRDVFGFHAIGDGVRKKTREAKADFVRLVDRRLTELGR